MKKFKSVSEIDSHIAKKESKKSQVSIGNVREIRGIICDLLVSCPENLLLLVQAGQRRARDRKKK